MVCLCDRYVGVIFRDVLELDGDSNLIILPRP